MTSGVFNSDFTALRAALINQDKAKQEFVRERAATMQTAENIIQEEAKYDASINTLESLLNTQTPFSKNSALQARVNETHAIYQKLLQTTIATFKNLKELTLDARALTVSFDLSISESHNFLENILSRYNPLVDQAKLNETELNKLRAQIVELTS